MNTAPAAGDHAGTDLVPVRRALISVSDKTGLADFATALVKEFNVELISTGGTAKFLRDAGLKVTDVSEVTGFPEMMDGRVKTLHPKIHGGLLALRDNPEHAAAMKAHDIKPIDLVVINLYPFKKTIEKPGVTFEEAIENIDIGGPSMVRSAAKNHHYVLVLTSPDRYEKALGDLRKHKGSSCAQHRLKQAQRAFAHTAEYDTLIASYLEKVVAAPAQSNELLDVEKAWGIVHKAASVALGTKDEFFESTQRGNRYQIKQIEGSRIIVDRLDATQPVELTEGLVRGAIERFNASNGRIARTDFIRPVARECALVHLHPALAWSDDGNYIINARKQSRELPPQLTVALVLKQTLRYGENPHQQGALYVDRKTTEASVTTAVQHHGKELSYINLLDADAALNAVKELATPAACIVKHATPCGYATAADLPTAFRNAFAGDPLAAFGGIVALNKTVDLATAQAITSIDKLLEVIVAPNYAADALELLKSRWKNVRLLEVGPVTTEFDRGELMMHKIVGGYLVQERDLAGVDESQWKVVSQRQPTPQERIDLAMAWLAAKHVKSNAIAIAKDGMMLGSGAGQQDRVNACRIAIAKSGDRAKGAAAGSDAFFPFPDGPELLLDAGVTAIIHPGGSVKDQETIDLVNKRGATMVFTGQRHFRH